MKIRIQNVKTFSHIIFELSFQPAIQVRSLVTVQWALVGNCLGRSSINVFGIASYLHHNSHSRLVCHLFKATHIMYTIYRQE